MNTEYSIAKIGVGTAENEPANVCYETLLLPKDSDYIAPIDLCVSGAAPAFEKYHESGITRCVKNTIDA